jgi:hypothetical protein
MRMLLLLIFAVVLAGCATTTGYRQKLAAWIGGNETALLESNSWGVPDKTFQQANGNTIYCYHNRRIETSPTEVYTDGYGGATVFGGSVYERACETCFYMNQNKIIYHYTFKGNDCLARELRS